MRPIVLVGGFLSWPGHYRNLARILEDLSGGEVYVVPLTPVDWLAGLARGWGQLVFEVATTVDKALLESESKRAVVVAHSSGGVAARVYIGGDAPFGGRRYSGHRRVSDLITLGTPHLARQRGPTSAIARVNELFPGALHRDSIRYLSVAGAAVEGASSAKSRWFYGLISGDEDLTGDGIVPVDSALLPGAEHLVFDDLRHDWNRKRKWYGSNQETVERWWPKELCREE